MKVYIAAIFLFFYLRDILSNADTTGSKANHRFSKYQFWATLLNYNSALPLAQSTFANTKLSTKIIICQQKLLSPIRHA